MQRHVDFIYSATRVALKIPTGFRSPAQSCDAEATLGSRPTEAPNPNEVGANPHPLLRARLWTQPVGVETGFQQSTQGSSFLATAGLVDSIPLGLHLVPPRLRVFRPPLLLFPVRLNGGGYSPMSEPADRPTTFARVRRTPVGGRVCRTGAVARWRRVPACHFALGKLTCRHVSD